MMPTERIHCTTPSLYSYSTQRAQRRAIYGNKIFSIKATPITPLSSYYITSSHPSRSLTRKKKYRSSRLHSSFNQEKKKNSRFSYIYLPSPTLLDPYPIIHPTYLVSIPHTSLLKIAYIFLKSVPPRHPLLIPPPEESQPRQNRPNPKNTRTKYQTQNTNRHQNIKPNPLQNTKTQSPPAQKKNKKTDMIYI